MMFISKAAACTSVSIQPRCWKDDSTAQGFTERGEHTVGPSSYRCACVNMSVHVLISRALCTKWVSKKTLWDLITGGGLCCVQLCVTGLNAGLHFRLKKSLIILLYCNIVYVYVCIYVYINANISLLHNYLTLFISFDSLSISCHSKATVYLTLLCVFPRKSESLVVSGNYKSGASNPIVT